MLRLVEDLLSLAGAGASCSIEPVDVGEIIDAASELLGPLLTEHARRVVTEVPAGTLVLADRGRLLQVLVNLVANAVLHGGSDARVTVRPGPDDTVLLAVRDHGPGIPADRRDGALEPFTRLGPTGGAGLGLAIAVSLAEAMGGTLVLADPVDGPGTLVELTLPAGTAAPTG